MRKSGIDIEKKSSAVTLSDMELFVFPELLYSLVLANIMSPRIWRWRRQSWFKGIKEMSPLRRIHRLKQFVMDNYAFNLDIETWGLTSKSRELDRFRSFVDEKILARSNALFGYEGDKYYFDIDIRRHFGLEKYSDDVIPYWKTETVEAMDAFRHKQFYSSGAGECVSLAALYAAALFIVAAIPLRDIFLMGTALHSQNFVNLGKGVLTNNRRIVTKNMWFNGTTLSAKARRALENEKVTVVAHESGYVHTLYEKATIDPAEYSLFSKKLRSYLKTELSAPVFGAFLRRRWDLHKCFQLRGLIRGHERYVGLETLFEYELKHPYFLTDSTRKDLINTVSPTDFHASALNGRIVLNDIESHLLKHPLDLSDIESVKVFEEKFSKGCFSFRKLISAIKDFCITEPQLPDIKNKKFVREMSPGIEPDMDRDAVIKRLSSIRKNNETVDLAFYAFRDMRECETGPFAYAAVCRNPVSLEAVKGLSVEEAIAHIRAFNDESIYDEDYRIAQPDEVWNFVRGDGLEKAFLAANIFCARDPRKDLSIELSKGEAILRCGKRKEVFPSRKTVKENKIILGRW
ncbi:MAG: hypothetical protein COS41_03855 [Elusimicrobia bacterium CG03_land_8_20_14_0_80_50_18]|nr:MAG: hypothetical protein COS41_03855 [Elusimicrobia bacterium CG03_land_8_20_14_0_80_50_18]PIX15369.1 MAG: hypothetical protein COZ72_03695 [Elusimicrobia bacterium CG_4_8_14_3_um_filter_50_9]